MTNPNATRSAQRGSRLVILNATQSGAPVAERDAVKAQELTEADLAAARRAFELKLRGKRMHPRWIEENAEEVFAKAQQEYAEWLAAGRIAHSPRAWLVHCAWRRTQDRLDYESRHGHSVPLEDVSYAIADEATRTPEQILLAGDRREQLLAALGELKPEHRELLKLVYFDNLEVKEAGEILGWTAPNASYHHKAVLRRLREVLDGKIDLPEIGSAAAAFVALEKADAFTLAGLIGSVSDAASAVANRLAELAQRLVAGADPANVSIGAGAARAAGICGAAVAAVCLAGGVVGPGLDAIGANPKPHSKPGAGEHRQAAAPARSVPMTASEASSGGQNAKATTVKAARRHEESAATAGARASRRRTSRPPREGGEDQVNAEATAEPAWSEPVEPRPMSSEESAGSEVKAPHSSGGSGSGTSPATEFGL